MGSLETGRISASSMALLVNQCCPEVALDDSRRRETFGQPIAEHQRVQFTLDGVRGTVHGSLHSGVPLPR